MPKEIRLRTETLTMYDRNELAEIFGVSAHSVWCWIKSGRLPGQLIGGKWYVTEDAVRRFLDGKTETREAPIATGQERESGGISRTIAGNDDREGSGGPMESAGGRRRMGFS